MEGVNEIVQRLKTDGKDLDGHLSVRERAEAAAFVAMLQGPLQTALDVEWYLNDSNWFELVRPLYT